MRLQLTVDAIFAAIFNMVQIYLASFEWIGFEREERNQSKEGSGGGGHFIHRNSGIRY